MEAGDGDFESDGGGDRRALEGGDGRLYVCSWAVDSEFRLHSVEVSAV